MPKMIKSLDELNRNIKVYESILETRDKDERAREILHKGFISARNFIAYQRDGEYHFVWAKFVELRAVSAESYLNSVLTFSSAKDPIVKLLGRAEENDMLNGELKLFCEKIGESFNSYAHTFWMLKPKAWLINADPEMYRHWDAFIKFDGMIDWRRRCACSVGDMVYIRTNGSHIQYQTKVVQTDVPLEQRFDDREFWIQPQGTVGKSHGEHCMRLELLKVMNEDSLSLSDLRRFKFVYRGQPEIKLEEMRKYIEEEFSKKGIDFKMSRMSKNTMQEPLTKVLLNKHNIILQGAPGTGKTYNTAALALSMIGKLPVRDADEDDKSFHKKVMDEYEKHLIKFDEEGNVAGDGQIGFVTFHQSMDYEDFVEGFKPQKEDKGVIYDIEDGIFKKIRELAFNNYEDSLKSEDEVKLDIDTKTVFERFCSQIEAELKEKDCIDLIPSSKLKIHKVFRRADGSAKSISISRTDTSPNQTLTLEMILRDYPKFKNGEIKSYEDIKPKYDSNSTYHGNAPYYFELLKQMKAFEEEHKISSDAQKVELKNYVLIIDEINRGNVSKIFGELISLLEADKRVGGNHPLTVTLPYSKESFSVPPNLYIIGTMNTTDRSVGSIDYAVRRRFAFVTLEADENKVPEGIARNLFNAVKNFLNKSKYDMDIEDLMVGHSYFMDANNLQMKWQYEILPLLMEYHKDGIISKSPLKNDSGNEIADVKKDYAKFVEAWQKKESDSPNP